MKVQCPKCSVTYELPDSAFPREKIGKKPQKVRCFSCSEVFSVSLEEKATTQTENTNPPPEALAEKKVQTETQPNSPTTPEQPAASAVESTPETQNRLFLNITPIPTEDSPTDRQSPAAPTVNRTSQWNEKNTLDLTKYAVKSKLKHLRKAVIAALAVIVPLSLLFCFVAAKNNWALSASRLGDQIRFAFAGPASDSPATIKNLNIIVNDKRLVMAKDGRRLLVVFGEVHNPTSQPRNHVLLRGRIIDTHGDAVKETVVPCGRVRNVAKLQNVRKGKFDKHYKDGNKPYNCRIRSRSNRQFQLVFDDVKVADKDKIIDIQPESAHLALKGKSATAKK